MHKSALFILKKNETYGFISYTRRSSGLWNSTNFIVNYLKEKGIRSDIVEVQDNNSIDAKVTKFKPDIVIIEALWIVPEKFKILKKLHPNVQWYVHLHSEMPFLSLEGIAMEWIPEYVNHNVKIIANSLDSYNSLRCIIDKKHLFYLPNVYEREFLDVVKYNKDTNFVAIACLGAIRPFKNHLEQALAAIKFSRQLDKPMAFYINSSRIEVNGEPVLKNLRSLFDKTPGNNLVELDWMEPENMIKFLHSYVDIGMQVSLTETFNVVTADYVTAGIPVVVSPEVKWVSDFCKSDASDIDSIVDKMHRVLDNKLLVKWNQHLLKRHSNNAKEMWIDFIRHHS